MRKTMIKLGLSTITLLLCLGVMAQKGAGKERKARILEKKKAYCNEKASLTEKEASAYWAIDAELMEEKKALRKEVRGIKDMDLDTSPESEIESAIRKGLDSKVHMAELEAMYVDKFLEVVSAKKLALVKQAERSFKKEVLQELKRGGGPGPEGGRGAY